MYTYSFAYTHISIYTYEYTHTHISIYTYHYSHTPINKHTWCVSKRTSVHTYDWVLIRVMTHKLVTNMCHRHLSRTLVTRRVIRMIESWYESWHTNLSRTCATDTCHEHLSRVVSHVWLSHITHMTVLCPYNWVISHIWTSSYMCHTCNWVVSHKHLACGWEHSSCNTLQHTATHCNTLQQHISCNTLHTATHCNSTSACSYGDSLTHIIESCHTST